MNSMKNCSHIHTKPCVRVGLRKCQNHMLICLISSNCHTYSFIRIKAKFRDLNQLNVGKLFFWRFFYASAATTKLNY